MAWPPLAKKTTDKHKGKKKKKFPLKRCSASFSVDIVLHSGPTIEVLVNLTALARST